MVDLILKLSSGVIPPADYDFLYQAGVSAIFGPGTKIALAASTLLNLMIKDKMN